jgi:long-chain acyl-CoA synthetase
MSDPLALLPYALAAANGRIDDVAIRDLVAAGVTLLRRAPVVPQRLAGRRSAILLPMSPAVITALAASDGRGAVLCQPAAASSELEAQLRDADVGVVFTTATLASRVPADRPVVLLDDAPRSARVVVPNATARDVALDGEHGLSLSGDPEADGRDEEAVIVHTSAMAGEPLGAILTHRNLLANARGAIRAADLTSADRALAMLPVAQLFGATVSLFAPLLAGASVVTMPRFAASRALDRIVDDRVTVLVGVPVQFIAMLDVLERRGGRLRDHLLRLCVCGGAPIDLSVQERWFEATGVELRQGYGITEAGPVCLFNRVGLPNHRGTVGVPFPGVEVSVRHVEHGTPLPPKVEGELCVRGDSVSPGYVARGDAGLARRDGWLRTGDRAVQHGDGTFTYRGTLKPVFAHRGYDIYPREIERTLEAIPGVTRARVWPIPNSSGDSDIAAEVWGDVTDQDVRRWCAERLAMYKQPRAVFVNALVTE